MSKDITRILNETVFRLYHDAQYFETETEKIIISSLNLFSDPNIISMCICKVRSKHCLNQKNLLFLKINIIIICCKTFQALRL